MAEEYMSFEDALAALGMQEAELRSLVAQGKLRAFRDENILKFRRSDIEGLRQERGGAPATPEKDTAVPEMVAPGALDEEPTDLLADEAFDFDDQAETLVGGDIGPAGDIDLSLDEAKPAAPAPGEPSTKVPTIELTAPDTATDETAVPTLDLGDMPTASPATGDTEVPTMVLGLDQYDDSQMGTEDIATEEVSLEPGELSAETEEATAPYEGMGPQPIPEDLQPEPAPGTGRVTPASAMGTGEALFIREQPSALYTVMNAIAAFVLLVPGALFFYCVASSKVPGWEFLKGIMQFFWDLLGVAPPGGTP